MASEKLTLKYRPKTLNEIVGQEVNVAALQNIIANGMSERSFVFAGLWGSGKTSAARCLAAHVNCLKPAKDAFEAATPCGECSICKGVIDKGKATDYYELDGAVYGNIENVRQLHDVARTRPMSKYVFVVLDEAHRMSGAALDALLKIVE